MAVAVHSVFPDPYVALHTEGQTTNFNSRTDPNTIKITFQIHRKLEGDSYGFKRCPIRTSTSEDVGTLRHVKEGA